MPAPPELSRTLGDVGIVEIPRIVESHHLAKTDGHIRIAGEIEVDLKGVCSHSREAPDETNLGGRAGKKRIRKDTCRVSEQYLLAQTYAEEAQALRKAGERDTSIVDFMHDIGIAHDRASNELREHRDIHAQIKRVLLGLDLASVDINDVGDCLQGEE